MKNVAIVPLLALAFTPLIIDRDLFFPNFTGKVVFFRFAMALCALAMIFLLAYSKEYRERCSRRLSLLCKHSIAWALGALLLVTVGSALFALDKFEAWWGNLERAEGVAGLLFFVALFVYTAVLFGRKEWLRFIKLSVVVSFIIVIKEIMEVIGGTWRPESFIGNSAFLAGYLLFSISCALILFAHEKSKWWRYVAGSLLVLAIVGVLLTQTRGAIVGFLAGCMAVLAYIVLRAESIRYGNIAIRKVAIGTLSFIVVLLITFVLTRTSGIWNNVPGLSRFASIGSADVTTKTRLLSIESSLSSVDPEKSSVKKLLIGWGPENYIQAFARNYNAEQFKYESGWFDRAHNRLLDALVMTGIFGLLAYLAVWFFFFCSIARRREFALEDIGLLFFGTAYFVHLLFVFDHTVTLIPLFTLLAFSASIDLERRNAQNELRGRLSYFYTIGLFGLLSVFVIFLFARDTLPGFLQMKRYAAIRSIGEPSSDFIASGHRIFGRSTTAQSTIRRDFITYAASTNNNDLMEYAQKVAETYIEDHPYNFKFMSGVAELYGNKGATESDIEYLKKSEVLFRRTIETAPHMPDLSYALALTLSYQKEYEEAILVLENFSSVGVELPETDYYFGIVRWLSGAEHYKESLDYLERAFEAKPALFTKDTRLMMRVYQEFLQRFYVIRDRDRFLVTVKRMVQYEERQKASLMNMIEILEEKEVWPNINFRR